MLERRIKEVAAIRKLKEVSRTDEYKKALKAAVASRLGVAKDVVTNPVGTITGIPKGLFKFANRMGQSVKEKTEKRQRSQYEDSNAASLIGFSKAKRTVAIQLGVDPYSSNETLQRELNGVANRAAFVDLAGSEATDEGDALFFLGTSQVLAELHAKKPIARLQQVGRIPVALGKDGRAIVAIQWDYAAWTDNAANFIGLL